MALRKIEKVWSGGAGACLRDAAAIGILALAFTVSGPLGPPMAHAGMMSASVTPAPGDAPGREDPLQTPSDLRTIARDGRFLWRGSDPSCAAGPCTWERTFGAASDDKLSAVIPVDAGFVATGNSRAGRTGPYGAWMVGLTQAGDPLWRRDFEGAQTRQLRDIVALADGGFWAAGHTHANTGGTSDLWLVRLDETGTTLFERTYGSPAHDRARAAVPTEDGGVIVAGFTASHGAGGRDLWVTRHAADGTLVWSQTLGTEGGDEAFDLVRLPGGDVAVTGTVSAQQPPGSDLVVARLSPEGAVRWQRIFDRSPLDVGTALTALDDGGLVVVGNTSVQGLRDTDVWAMRLNADGAMLWARILGGARVDEPWEVIAGPSNAVTIASESFSTGEGGDIWLVHLDPDGEMLWQRHFGGALWDKPSALVQMDDGGLLLGGHTASKGAGFEDGWLLRLTSDGRL